MSPTFIAHPLPTRGAHRPAAKQRRRHTTPRASAERRVAAPATQQTTAPAVPTAPARGRAQRRGRARARVVDSRVGGALETHHWVTVAGESASAFEKAATSHASVAALLEQRTGAGRVHRWLLRAAPSTALGLPDGTFRTDKATYCVMECFGGPAPDRWLGAVKRAAPALGAHDIRSLQYASLFAARAHTADKEPAAVVVEGFNAQPEMVDAVAEILRDAAEASVNAGQCVAFSVLQAENRPTFFKTVAVYADAGALRAHRDGFDRAVVRRTAGKTIGEHRSRQTFTPVLFE